MASRCVETADIVAAGLAAQSFVRECVVIRSYAQWDELLQDQEAGRTRIDVVPVGAAIDSELADRKQMTLEPLVDVGVRRLFAESERDELGAALISHLDTLIELVEQIHAWGAARADFGVDWLSWAAADIRLLYSRPMLRKNNQFMGIVRFAFTAQKSI